MSHGNVDLISNMPGNVTAKILECLPLEDAVKTSILSTKWRYKWASIPHIILDERFYSTNIDGKMDSSAGFSDVYVNIVNNVLLCHVGRLRMFVLNLPPYVTKNVNVGQWIQSVSGKGGLKEFTLIGHNHFYLTDKLLLPSIVLSFTGLTNLKLTLCHIPTLPQWFTGFPCLVELGLVDCKFKSSVELETFIFKCPLLRHLELHSLVQVSFKLTIHAPNLQYLLASGFNYTFCLGYEITKIKSLHLDISVFSKNTLRSLFLRLPEIEFLRLGTSFWAETKRLGHEILLKEEELVDVFSRLRTLELIGIPLHCSRAIELARGVLSNSYRLQRLTCQVSECTSCKLDTRLLIKCCNTQEYKKGLKYAKFVCVSGLALEFDFMKVILKCAPELEVMSIELDEKINEAEEMLRICIELMRFPRASRNAELIFKATYTV